MDSAPTPRSTRSYDAPVQTEELLERRIVTVLFADLVGFTTLSEQFDAEDVASIQDSYFATVRETVGRYGGRLEKFIGDAAMAVFGAPRTRDDDAERAVRAGLALVRGIQQIGARLGLDDDVLRLRVGINTGEIVLATGGEDDGRVTGDTVNTAARLQTAAPPGGVLIGDTTALAVAGMADLKNVPQLELKGKAEPTPAHLVTGLRSEPSRERAMGALRAPTLGRDRELAALEQATRRATAGGVERWLIVAPPGVGKSRLLREFASRLSRDDAPTGRSAVVWRARARPDSVSPFDPIAGLLLDALAGAGLANGSPSEADRRSAAESLIRDGLAAVGTTDPRRQVVIDACMALAWPPAATEGAKPTDDRATLFGAWIDGLGALAGDVTQAWLVEDIHWAGGDVLAFLDEAGASEPGRAGRGRLVIATSRPSLLDGNAAWSADDPAAGRHVVHLSTLPATDAAGLVKALVGDALPLELVERIAERSDGNCLFIEELLRTWVSVGTLIPESSAVGSSWLLSVTADEIPLPASVQSIYAAQLDDLPPAARRLARRASVAGRRFPVGALEPLGIRASEGLQSLRRRELIIGPLSEPVWGDAFAYRHALLRDAGYASLARAERARLHIRLAKWLEQAVGQHADEMAEQIAAHYAAALDSAPALARELDEGLDRESVRALAAHWYERAGQGTLALSAHDAARQLFRRAIDLTADEALVDMARRWERLGDATAFAANMDEGAAAYNEAIALYRSAMAAASDELAGGKRQPEAETAVARSGLARATAELSNVIHQQLRFADAGDLSTRVIEEIGAEADPVSLARLMVARASAALGVGGPSPAIEDELARALELARTGGDRHTELLARRSLTDAREQSGRAVSGEWQEIVKSALDLGQWATAVSASIELAMLSLDDHAADVRGPIEQARHTAEAHGLTDSQGWAYYVDAEAAFISGDWARAIEAGNRAVEIGEVNAYLLLASRTWHVLIPIAGVRGDIGTLEHAARWYRSLEGKFEFPDGPYARLVRAARKIELSAAGLRPTYVPEVEPRLVSFADEPGGGSRSAAFDRVFRCWIEMGRVDGADRALAAMTSALPRFDSTSSLGMGTYHLMRGRLAAARSDEGASILAGRAALDHFRISSAPWWMAKAIRLLERVGTADQALIAEVEQIEQRLGAVSPTA